jgi:mRNA interferase MazF
MATKSNRAQTDLSPAMREIFLTPMQVAQKMQVRPRTVQAWLRMKQLKGTKLHALAHPAVVVWFFSRTGALRFPLLTIVPMTSDRRATWAVANPAAYPLYPAGTSRLRNDTLALVDQVRAVDVRRIRNRIGTPTPAEYAPIEAGLRARRSASRRAGL